MLTKDLQYELPPDLIAEKPADRRDASRLMVVNRNTGDFQHVQFTDLMSVLPSGALLVANNTRVLPARLRLRRATGGQVEGLFVHEPGPNRWEVMLSAGGRLVPGESLHMGDDQVLRLIEQNADGTWLVEPQPAGAVLDLLNRFGDTPLPPYIRKQRDEPESREWDAGRYQTVYADQPGAIAAPTAGLHFTEALIGDMTRHGFTFAYVTLHVGVGTFAPIRTDDLAGHRMHTERYECFPATADAVNAARAAGRPIVAVGTTTVRVLETLADESGRITPGSGATDIFIYPPYRFRSIDALITNFHLPGSTLLAMVFALAGRDLMLNAYHEAIEQRYRFFSYGDAMLIR